MVAMNLNEFCTQWLKSWTGNHPEALLEFYDDNAYYQDPAKIDGLRGKLQIAVYFKKLLARYPEWIWTSEEIIPTEKGFVLKWKAKRFENDPKGFFYGLDIVELNGSKITRNEVYFDPSALL